MCINICYGMLNFTWQVIDKYNKKTCASYQLLYEEFKIEKYSPKNFVSGQIFPESIEPPSSIATAVVFPFKVNPSLQVIVYWYVGGTVAVHKCLTPVTQVGFQFRPVFRLKVTSVTCEMSAVPFYSTKHSRFSPFALFSSCKSGSTRGGSLQDL